MQTRSLVCNATQRNSSWRGNWCVYYLITYLHSFGVFRARGRLFTRFLVYLFIVILICSVRILAGGWILRYLVRWTNVIHCTQLFGQSSQVLEHHGVTGKPKWGQTHFWGPVVVKFNHKLLVTTLEDIPHGFSEANQKAVAGKEERLKVFGSNGKPTWEEESQTSEARREMTVLLMFPKLLWVSLLL